MRVLTSQILFACIWLDSGATNKTKLLLFHAHMEFSCVATDKQYSEAIFMVKKWPKFGTKFKKMAQKISVWRKWWRTSQILFACIWLDSGATNKTKLLLFHAHMEFSCVATDKQYSEAIFMVKNGQNLAPSSRKWHKKYQFGESGGERKKILAQTLSLVIKAKMHHICSPVLAKLSSAS